MSPRTDWQLNTSEGPGDRTLLTETMTISTSTIHPIVGFRLSNCYSRSRSKEQENRGGILHICVSRIFLKGWCLLVWRKCDLVLIDGMFAVIVSNDSFVVLLCVVHSRIVAMWCTFTTGSRNHNNHVSCVCQSSVIQAKQHPWVCDTSSHWQTNAHFGVSSLGLSAILESSLTHVFISHSLLPVY